MGEGMITRSVRVPDGAQITTMLLLSLARDPVVTLRQFMTPGGSAEALTWGATFAEAMVVIVNAALTRVCAFACGDNGAEVVQRAPSAGFVTLVSQLPDKSILGG